MPRLCFTLLVIVALLSGCADTVMPDPVNNTPPAPSQVETPGPAIGAARPTPQIEPTATETRVSPPSAPDSLLLPTATLQVLSPTLAPVDHGDLDLIPKTHPRATTTLTPFRLATVTATVPIATSVRAPAIYRGDTTHPRAALTFDTGQGLPTVIRILDTLKAPDIHATFFLMGIWADKNGGVVKRIAAEGHELANHSYSHPNLNTIPDDQITAQVLRTEQIVQRLTGCTTRPFLRAPFGAANAHTQQVLARAGYYDVMWSAHGGDWLPGATAESIRRSLIRNTGNGSVIVLHSSAPQTAEALPEILADFKTKGLELVTLGELLREDASYSIPPPCNMRIEALE